MADGKLRGGFDFRSLLSSDNGKAEKVAVEDVIVTVDHSSIRGSKPHARDPSGAASY
jgi:hypothetical protein